MKKVILSIIGGMIFGFAGCVIAFVKLFNFISDRVPEFDNDVERMAIDICKSIKSALSSVNKYDLPYVYSYNNGGKRVDYASWRNDYAKYKKPAKDSEIITEYEFVENNEFNKETLYYYTEDGYLTSDDDEILIGSSINVLGNIAYKLDDIFNGESTKPIIYVRNYKNMIDYEICPVYGSYYEEKKGEE